MISLVGNLRKARAPMLCAAVVLAVPASAQVVGKAAAVNQDSKANGRTLEIGASVIHKERIQTSAGGSLQLLFIDRTSMSIGPNSDLVIDDYVFDPNKSVGKMTVSLAKGVMRFVGGQITHTGSASVNTPPATIGIRGGVVDINTDGKTTSASASFGAITITPTTGPGSGIPVSVPQGSTGTTGGGAAPTVASTTQQQVNSNNQQFQSKAGQIGGVSGATSSTAASLSSRTSPTTATITPSSPPAPGSAAAGPSSTAPSSPINPSSASNTFSSGAPPSVTTSAQSVQTTSANTASQNTTSQNTAPPPPPPPPPPCTGKCPR
jgi:hypothetical protein